MNGSSPRIAAAVLLLAAACGTDSTAPSTSLVGTWDFIGFADMGVAATTSGTWVFRADSTLSVNGTITFPGEPTDSLVVDGSYVQNGNSVVLTIAAETGTWTLTASGNVVTLTQKATPSEHRYVATPPVVVHSQEGICGAHCC